MNKYRISVILPSLNVRQYIGRSIESVISQTLKDIQIVCVDAGSTDGTLEILENYAKHDDRITLLHSDRKSYGAQMNMGIAAASGEFIGILETDDFISPNMYEELLKLADLYSKADIIKGSYWKYYDYDCKEKLEEPLINKYFHPYKANFDVWTFPNILDHHPSIWSCIYRMEFIKKEKLFFVEAPGAGWVDNTFFIESFCKAKSIVWTPKQYYYYRQTNPDASSHVKNCKIPFNRIHEILDFLDNNGIVNKGVLRSVYKRACLYARNALENPNYNSETDDAAIISELLRIDRDLISDPAISKKDWDAYCYFMELNKSIHREGNNFQVESLQRQISLLESEVNKTKNSKSYKLGRCLTFIPRKIRGLIYCYKEYGLDYTIRRALEHLHLR